MRTKQFLPKLDYFFTIFAIPKKENNMWQRIQTLYLAISTILMAVMLFSVKATVPGADGAAIETYKYLTYIPYAILIIIIILLDILALTTYRFRVFQYRTAVLSALVTLGLQIWLGIEFFVNLHAGAEGSRLVYKLNVVFPLVSVILDALAARGILADELLVESTYRLRRDRKNRKKRS